MKKVYLILILLVQIFNLHVHATIHIINQTNTSFSPSSINVAVGDTVKWVWSSGTHTTTSRNIPAGAEPWDSNLDNDNETFMYKVNVAGTYNYACKPHENMGMTGSFTATVATSNSIDTRQSFSVYPNPAHSHIIISSENSHQIKTIEIVNIIGQRIYFEDSGFQPNINAVKEIDVSNFNSGVYLVSTTFTNGKRRSIKLSISGK